MAIIPFLWLLSNKMLIQNVFRITFRVSFSLADVLFRRRQPASTRAPGRPPRARSRWASRRCTRRSSRPARPTTSCPASGAARSRCPPSRCRAWSTSTAARFASRVILYPVHRLQMQFCVNKARVGTGQYGILNGSGTLPLPLWKAYRKRL